jgi:AcrR family transcriptional regulator
MSRKKASRPRARDSQATRSAILAAARSRFAQDGYERATIRAIAADAGIDPALVIRYFESKEKLFATAADFDLKLPDLSAIPDSEIGTALVSHFVQRWEQDDTFLALLRAAISHEAADERVRSVFRDQVAPAIAALSTSDPKQAPVRAALVSSQLLGMAFCRFVLGVPALVKMSRSELIAWMGPTIQRYVTGQAPSGDGRTDFAVLSVEAPGVEPGSEGRRKGRLRV